MNTRKMRRRHTTSTGRLILLIGLLVSCCSAQAAITFSISGSDERVQPGEQFQVEWVLSNTGSSTELDVTVQLIFPVDVNRLYGPYMEGASCVGTYCDPGDNVTWTVGDLPPGESRSVYFSPIVSSTAINGTLLWDATAYVGSSTAASSTWDQQIDSGSVLELAIDSDRALIAPGDPITYSIAFGNAGVSELMNATLILPLPAGISALSAPGGSINSSNVSWSLGNLPVDDVGRRYVTLSTPSGAVHGSQLRIDNAQLSGSYQGVARSVTTDHVAVFGNSVLDLELRTQEGTAKPGEQQIVEVVVGNDSGVVQQNITVTMLFPVGVDRFYGPYMEGASCIGTYCDPGDTTQWTISSLLPGEIWSASFTPTVSSSVKPGYPIVWQARVEAGSDMQRREQIITLAGDTAPELSISADSSQAAAGEEFTWWFNYGNRGIAPLESAELIVPLPPDVTVVDTHGGSNTGTLISWALGSVPSGYHGRRALTVRVSSSAVNGQLISLDRAQISGVYFGLEQVTEAEHIVDVGDSPLQVELRALPGIPGQARDMQFEFVVSNRSADVQTGVTLDALYPVYLTRRYGPYMEGSSCVGTYCDPTDHAVWTFGNLLPGETRSVTFATSTTSGALLGDSSDWVATVAANGAKRRRADLSVGLSDAIPELAIVSSRTLALPGESIEYTFSPGNPSGSLLVNPELTLLLPDNVELVSAPGATVTGQQVLWQLADLPTDTVGEVKMTLRVPSGTPSGTLLELRNAELRGNLFGISQSSKVSHFSAVGDSPLAVSMSVTPGYAEAGDGLNVELVVTNTGSTLQQAVELDLLYPDGLIRLSAANMADAVCTGGYCDPGDHAVWELGNLQPNEVRTINFAPTISSSLTQDGRIMHWQARVAVSDGKQRRAQAVVGIGSEFDFGLPGGSGATPTPEVDLVTSCLAGNGRVDLNIVNSYSALSAYRLEFQGLTARQTSVAFEDWGRMPITGRQAGTYSTIVKRDGQTILSESLTFDCNSPSPTVSTPELRIQNACRTSNGYVIFQLVNPTASTRPYVIEFEGVPNRSTSAAPFGQAVRATTGRPDGTYDYLVRTGSTTVDSGQVTVDCD